MGNIHFRTLLIGAFEGDTVIKWFEGECCASSRYCNVLQIKDNYGVYLGLAFHAPCSSDLMTSKVFLYSPVKIILTGKTTSNVPLSICTITPEMIDLLISNFALCSIFFYLRLNSNMSYIGLLLLVQSIQKIKILHK